MDVKFWDKLNDDEKLNLVALLEEKSNATEELYFAERDLAENLRELISKVTLLYNHSIQYNEAGTKYEKIIREYRNKYELDQKSTGSEPIYKKDGAGLWTRCE